MYKIDDLLTEAVRSKASDLHISVGVNPCIRVNGVLYPIGEEKVTPDISESLVKQILDNTQFYEFMSKGDYDLSYSINNIGRFRVNVFKQRGTCGMAIRSVGNSIPSLDSLKLPPILRELTKKNRGLILVTGPTGSGKSTTLASMIDVINKERSCHILTLEDPIEYLHRHNKSIVNQREFRTDFTSFSAGLRAGLRQDPDVILLGEMRDIETMEIALTAAETGHLVFSTLHTIGAASTIDRIIDVFPPHQQQQTVIQLANVLEAVISQQLMPEFDGNGRVVATEIMVNTPAIKNLIREKKTHQIQNFIATGAKVGMHTMDSDILELYRKNYITKETLFNYSIDQEFMKRVLIQ